MAGADVHGNPKRSWFCVACVVCAVPGNALGAAKVDVNGVTVLLHQLGCLHQVLRVIGAELHKQGAVALACGPALIPVVGLREQGY